MQNDAEQLTQISQAIEIVRLGRRREWTKEFGDARAFLCQILERDLTAWIKANPPEVAGYNGSDPHNALYGYEDALRPELKNEVITEILFTRLFDNVASRALKSLKAAGAKDAKATITRRYPEYPALCRDIRAMKKQWNEEDAAIKQTQAFRVMGGLARFGSRAGSEYRRLVEKAQQMERAVLGKILTKTTRPR